jgi:aspartate/methionine/tyrosine aminotransferase
MNFADRMSRLGTESAFEVLARAKALERQGKEIIHLEIGEPDFDTPKHIREAGKRALDGGATHYGPAAGLPELREAIVKDVEGTRSIPVTAEEIVVTPGAKPIMYFVITALVNPGDEVVHPNPGFPIYESVINFVGGKPVPIPLREESGFGFDLDVLEKSVSRTTKLIIVNSPQNPTGGVLEVDQLGRIAEIAKHFHVPVLADEIYKSFLYEGEFASITRFPGMKDLVIILDGFSKAYAMTGWRLGYGVMPVALAEHVTRLMVNSNSCTASFTQLAGIAALQGDQTPVAEMVAGATWWWGASTSCRASPAAPRAGRSTSAPPCRRSSARRRRSRRFCCRRRAWRCWAAPPSASTARGTCVCPTRPRRPTCARRSSAWSRCSAGSPARTPPGRGPTTPRPSRPPCPPSRT